VAINRKDIVGITRERKKTNSVALVLLDVDHGQWRAGTFVIATKTIYEGGIRCGNCAGRKRWRMVPDAIRAGF
jgi:hypothetical protein